MKNKLLSVFLILSSYTAYSQVGIGTTMPNSSTQLEVVASDKGVLIPRINLTSSTDAVTIKNGNINSLLVFNTATVSDLKPGYYYWYNTKWNRIVISSETNSIPGTVTYNPTNNVFSYVDNTGVSQVIDIGAIIKSKETVTTIVGNPDGSYTYTNEAGTAVKIDIVGDVTTNFSTIVNNPGVTNIIEQIVDKTKGIVIFNSTTNQFSYIDNAGNPQLVDISTIVKANETVTTLINNGGGSYTYNNESGAAVNIDVVGDVTTNFTTIANDPAVTNIIQNIVNKTAGNVTFNSTTNQFSYIDNSGNTQLVDISTIVKANETVTTLINNGGGSYTYNNESGAAVNIDVVGDVTTNFTTIANDPAVTNIIQNIVNKTAGNVTFNSTTNQFSYIDNSGNTQLVDISTIVKANETVTTLAQNTSTGAITYNNETGIATIVQVKSADAGNILGVGTDGGSLLTPATISNATTVSNASSVNTSTITVNGVTSTGAPIVNSNSTSLTGSSLTTTVNGVASTPLDLAPAIAAGQVLTNLAQDPASGLITYTNENAVDQTAVVTSTDAGNILGVGTDGGSLLTPATISNATTVSNASSVNTSTITVNGVTSTGAPIVNSNATSITGSSLTTTVNGVASTPLDLAPAIAAGQVLTNLAQDPASGLITYTNENAVDQTAVVTSTDAGNILGVGTDGGSLLTPTAITSATTVSNASSVNTSTITVNGVTSTGAPIVNSNATSLTGSSLTTTVNGVASTALDLAPAITSAQTITNLAQDPASGLITYTNENAVDQTAVVTSTDAGNILGVGTDGGSLLTPTAITSATTVSNASSVNTTTVTVNGVTSTGAPIVNSNATSITGSSLTTTVNGVASAALDLAPAITSATTVSNASLVNTSTITVNGVTSTGAPIVNSNGTSLTGSSLTTTVNGVSSTPLDLAPAIAAGQVLTNLAQDPASGLITYTNENAVDQTAVVTSTDAGNILGVGTDGGSLLTPTAITSATTVSNASLVNTSTITVNGVTSTGAPIVNSNGTSLTGSSLTTTVNGVSSTPLDLAPAIAAGQVLTNLAQDPASGLITYTNENAVDQTAVVTSTDAGNILGVGTDGGSLLTPTAITTATTVSNASSVNTSTITVNGKTSTGAPIVNSNATSLTGSSLTTTVNGVASTALDLAPAISAATTNTLTATDGNLISTVNGVATSPAVPVLITADNGLTATNGNVQLGGTLTNPTSILTDPSNTLAIEGLMNAPPFNDVVVVDPFTGVLQKTTVKELNFFNWSIEGNMGIQSSFHFLGTIDDADLVFKRNSTIAGRLQVNNTSFGVNALTDSSGGINNVAVGTLALSNNTTGQNNTSLGFSAMTSNTTGSENIGAGYFALNLSTNGGQNTAFGNSSFQNLTQGNRNTAIGYSSGLTLGSGEDVTLIGAFTGSADGLSYATAIGSGAFVATSNSLVLGGANTNVGIGTDSPTNTFHIIPATGIDPVRVEGLQTGINTDNVVVADANGVFKTVTASSLIPATTVSNTSDDNNLSTTVNGVPGTAVTIINSNLTSLSGASLVTTVNGVPSTALDLTPAIKANETVTVVAPVVVTGNTIANYTNEAGGAPVAIQESISSLNDVVTQGTDQYGQLIDIHTLTFTDEASVAHPINMSVLVKGVETLTSLTYDGAAHSLIYNDEDGNASEFKMVDLIGPAQTLTKLEVNATTGNLDYTDENLQLNSLDLSQAVKEPWFSTITNVGATTNTEDIYTNGWVGIGYTTPSAISNEKLRVNGGISTVNNYYADYVFEDYFKGSSTIKSDYKFKRLPEIEDYIKKYKHLPGITPINELEKTKEGYAFNMSELSIQLLEKTEEIYLHIIEQNKAIEAKDKEIQELKEASKQMNLRLEKLEKLITEQNK
ncbi:hypothetical protein SAMN05444397_11287 [Flavobacterium aquidurense]|nr:hypothetical protein SAMN05444397_11287 [Flavobacterium aquidurense]